MIRLGIPRKKRSNPSHSKLMLIAQTAVIGTFLFHSSLHFFNIVSGMFIPITKAEPRPGRIGTKVQKKLK